ncbi:hypothetical protein DNTS_001975 [Danionella cerebrum]|uniref:Uncharacterized protein n=1 Tax=Danionella cerebrum TaxID=2873325 RepID=A0A553PIQ9_9TELE|nr:hypothetical protein DNTS_001975 [Danionella translucida]
MARESSSHSF